MAAFNGASTSNYPSLLNQLRSRNVLINGDFRVNQRVYASAAVLASGSYGHDRWKAGASGGDYSFTQLANTTVITIASGKSLIQVVEDKNVVGGTYVLSWVGTAQARYAINNATPSGSYAASPIVIAGQTTGTVMSVEFNTGTLSEAMLEVGTSVGSNFERRTFQEELALCQRYYWKTFPYATTPATNSGVFEGCISYIAILGGGTTYYGQHVRLPVQMRTTPTATFFNPGAANAKWRNVNLGADSSTIAATANQLSGDSFTAVNQQVAGDAVSHTLAVHVTLSAEL